MGLRVLSFPAPSGTVHASLEFSRTWSWPKNRSELEPDVCRQEERFEPDAPVLRWPPSWPLSQLLLCQLAPNWVNWEQRRGGQREAGGSQPFPVVKPLGGSFSLLQTHRKLGLLCLNGTPQ